MSDILALIVPTPTYEGRARYVGVNAISDHGAFRGRKSPEYLTLFRSVREAARRQMAVTGWETWAHPCEVQVVRYHRTRRMSDAGNLAKCELDSLRPSTAHEEKRDRCAPFAGVYLDDDQVRPYRSDVEYDPRGIDRIVIVVRRRYPDIDVAPAPAKKIVKPKAHAAIVDGKPMSISEILTRMR